jgi:uncharacterized domain HDIG
MENVKIKDLIVGSSIDTFLLVGSLKDKFDRNDKPFVELVLEDGTDKVGGKIWSSTSADYPDIKAGNVIKIRAKVGQWEGKLQLTVQKCRAIILSDDVNADDFVRKAPIEAEEMFNFIMGVIENFVNPYLKLLTATILNNNKEKLLYFPGGQSVHHDIKSGLLYHMIKMLQSAIKIAELYEGINKDLLFSGVILHDIGKVEELGSDTNGRTEDYTKEGKMLGHLVQGIKIVAFASKDLEIPEEVSTLIEHMIASHHGDESMGALKKPMFLEADILHNLDAIDSRVYMYKEVNDSLDNNTFSDKQYFLGNVQIYKHHI